MESEMWRMAPTGVSIHTARMRMSGADLEAHEKLHREKRYLDAADDLATAEVDVIVYGCTSGSFFTGLEGEKRITAELKGRVKQPVITTSRAVVDAINALKAKNLTVATPYPKEIDELERKFLEDSGFSVLRIAGLEIVDGREIGRQPSSVSYRLAKKSFTPEADLIFISCTNFSSADIIEILENDLGRPVVTSTQASMWAALREINVGGSVVGYGRLLREHL
jgi:maleate isomerase